MNNGLETFQFTNHVTLISTLLYFTFFDYVETDLKEIRRKV